MHHLTPNAHGNSRVFIACLLNFVIMMTPIAAVAASTRARTAPAKGATKQLSPEQKLEASLFQPALAPPVPAITATKTDTYTNSPGDAAPGDEITYDINVTNSGTDATNVQFSDTIDANTTLVPGSLKASPLARNDSYATGQDTPLVVAAGSGVLANDFGLPAPTAVAIAGGATTQGGTVTLNTDGSFNYTPPSGFSGTDTFTYTATNGLTPDDTATVTITIDAAPTVSTTTPTNGATGVATNTNIVINFSESVNATTSSFTIECPAPGNTQTFTIGASPASSFTLDPNSNLPAGTTCTVTVVAAQITDADTNDPPDQMAADFVFSFTTDAAPTVTATTPVNGATDVASNANVTVTFSENVTAPSSAFTISCVTSGAHPFAISGGPTTFTLNPNTDFTQGEVCTVTVVAANVSDQDTGDPPDNMAANFVFSFTIDLAPSVTATTPTNGATDIPGNTDVTVTFSENVNAPASAFTISCGTSGAHTFAISGGPTTFTLNPDIDFSGGETCTVTVVAANVTDTDSNDPPDNMLANFVFSFTIDQAPSVTATTPADNAVQQANNTNITVTFSESVSATTSSFTISCVTSGAHTFALSGGPTTWTLNPDTDFTNGEVCTVTVVAAQVTDTDSNDPPNNMAADFNFDFTVDSPPAVTTTVPINGATGVAASTNITVNFSESVNATTSSFQIECPAVGNLQPFTLSASPASSFTLDPTSNLPIGVICTVTVFANQITDTDAGDPPDNMVADHVFSFSIPPQANDDARNGTGNIRIQTAGGSGFTVLTNDIGPGISVTAFDAASANGGVVTVAANGTFTYNPAPGFNGADTFNYTISNAAGSDVGTVTITVSGMIWFIDSSATACTVIDDSTGCGRLTHPLTTLAAFEAANGNADDVGNKTFNPAAGDHIYIDNGNSGVSAYIGPVSLEANQRVIGEGATSSLQTHTGITPATDSDALPSTGGTRPTITSPSNGFTLSTGNEIHGFTFSNVGNLTTNHAIQGSAGGSLILSEIGINNPSSNGGGISVTAGSLVAGNQITATGLNTILTRSGRALNLTNTHITASHLTFRSISAGNGTADADPVSGITLNNTGSTGSLIVTGNGGSCTSLANCTGGAIRNTTSHGIQLTSTLHPQFTRVAIQNTFGSGVHGNTVTNFTFQNGFIDNTGTGLGAETSSIAFNTQSAGTENNLSGTATISNNILSNAYYHGVDIYNHNGTISSVTISNNTITSSTSTVTSKGTGIRLVAFGSASTVAHVNDATISGNTITNFPSGAGITVQGGNASSAGATQGTLGIPNDVNNRIDITGNFIAGASSGNKMGTNAIQTSTNGVGRMNVNIDGNGSLASPITNIAGNVISLSVLGNSTGTALVNNNRIVANHTPNFGGPLGISAGVGRTFAVSDVASLTLTITNNNVSGTDAAGIQVRGTEGQGTMNVSIKNNTVAAPVATAARSGIRLEAGGSTVGTDNDICLDISGNTTAGSSDGIDTAPGIALRKQGTSTTVNAFAIEGMAATSTPGVENYVNGLNPGSSSGTFGVGGTALISATSGFSNCSAAPLLLGTSSSSWADGIFSLATAGTSVPAIESAFAALTQPQLEAIASVAIERWAATGLTPEQQASLRALQFEVADLQGTYLAKVYGHRIFVDRNAGGKGWFVDPTPKEDSEFVQSSTTRLLTNPFNTQAGRIDLLTALEHEIGHKLGLEDSYVEQDRDSLMFGYLHTGERKLPALGEAATAKPGAQKSPQYLSLAPESRTEQRKSVASRKKIKNSAAPRAAKAAAMMLAGETVNVNIGDMPAGKSVHIQFKVTINDGFSATSVSNQGTVTADGGINVLTDDPSVGGATDPTVTPALATPDISINDASAAEPASGSANAVFTVVLSHAFSQTVTVDFTTAAGGGNPATAGSDYTTTSGQVTFSPGEIIQSISVPVLADADNSETHETFLVNLTGTTHGDIVDSQATGTITVNNPAGTVLISELRTSGPGGAGDDFVEILNATDSDITVPASGWALVKSGATCNNTPVIVATIASGTVIPARGNYLLRGSAYSLKDYGGTDAAAGDQTLTSDIEDDRNVALFSTATPQNFSTGTRLDAVGFGLNTGNNCDLLREGSTLLKASGSTSEYSFVRKVDKGETLDTNANTADFIVVSTTPATAVGDNTSPILGAPGPEKSTSPLGPVPCNGAGTAKFGRAMLDSNEGANEEPNLKRDTTPGTTDNSEFGTIDFRRRFTNNTGVDVTRLRFRVVDMTTKPSPVGTADLRPRTSPDITVNGVNDPATCGGPAPCNPTVKGTTLETPPAQAIGGGVNSTLTVTLGTPLSNGSSLNLHFLFSVEQVGDYNIAMVLETLNSGDVVGKDVWELSGETETTTHTDGDCVFNNVAPVNSVPATQNMSEDQSLTFSSGTGNAISTSDADAGGATVEVTLTATNGTFSLGGTTGLTFTPAGPGNDGVNDTQMIFTGTIADINTAMNGIVFVPTPSFNGVASLTIETDDLGNTGLGGAKADTDTITINVNSINDPPSFTKGADQNINEDAGAQTVVGWATNISQGAGDTGHTLTFNVSVTGTTGNLAFSSAPAINSSTGTLTYTTAADTNGTANVSVTLSDNGSNVLPNDNESDAQTFVITVNAVNDAPSFQIASNPPAVNEDAGAQTVNSFATNFQPGPVTATDEGGQTLAGYTVTSTGTTGNLSFSSAPAIDNAGALTYTPTGNTSGTATFNVVATDSGSGTAPNVNQSAAVPFTITVNGQNDAPVLDNTGNMSLVPINEDFTTNGTLISDIIASAGGDRITDADAGAVEGIAVIAVDNTNGTWQYTIDGGTNWLAFGSPDTLNARLLADNLNTRIRFVPNANFNGTVDPGITFHAWDQTSGTNGGTADVTTNGGTTAFSTATETAAITVNPVNDAPTANGQSLVTNEDTPVGILLGGTDVETPSPGMTYTITTPPANGILSGTGNNRTYTPNPNYNGPDSFQFTVTDTGDGSSPPLTSAPATVNITVNAVNDAPVNTVPGAQSVVENGSRTFSAANGNQISVADVDAGSNQIQVTLTAGNGTLTLATTAGLTFSPAGPNNDGVADSTLTFNGTVTNINNALNGMVFTPTAGFSGATSIQIFSNDLGFSGSGGNLTDNDAVPITVLDGGTLQFSSATYAEAENVVNATITVTRTGGTAGEARIDYATVAGGTATGGGTDYANASGTLIFADGETSKTFTIPIHNDLIDEPDETVNLALSNPQGSGALGTPSTAVLTIQDNDAAPAIHISNATVTEGNSGTVNAVFTISLTNPSSSTVTVNYATADSSATTANNDYVAVPTTLLTFNPLETSKQVTVVVNGDHNFEPNEIFLVNLSSPSASATIGDPQGVGTINNDDFAGGLIQFSSATYTVDENDGSVDITVNRIGTTTQAVTVDYATSDMTALQKSDYTIALGTLKFAAGASSATFTVLVNMDSYAEGAELLGLALSNPTSGAGLGVPQNATLQINNVATALANTIDDPELFVIQHYHDFLNREPDVSGKNFWVGEINACGGNPQCIQQKRVHVSAAFFLSIEFTETGTTAYLTHTAAFGTGTLPQYVPFQRDTQALQRGFIFGNPGAFAVLEANKVEFFNNFVTRPEFTAIYGALSNEQYVDTLIANTGVTFPPGQRNQLVSDLNSGTKTRAQVLREIVENNQFEQAQFNRAFVLMQYFGYLRRNPNDPPDSDLSGYNFWLNKLNSFNGNFIEAEMVKAFIESTEYRERFGTP